VFPPLGLKNLNAVQFASSSFCWNVAASIKYQFASATGICFHFDTLGFYYLWTNGVCPSPIKWCYYVFLTNFLTKKQCYIKAYILY